MSNEPTFRNYYLVNEVEGWAAVCISKNACTSLKAAVLRAHGRPVPESIHELHDAVGYEPSALLRPVEDGAPPGVRTFAVWRDPVDRWYSATAFLRRPEVFALRRNTLGTVSSLRLRFSLAQAVAVTEQQLGRDPRLCDEHWRRQCDYCDPRALDDVVPLGDLAGYFDAHGWASLPRVNEAAGKLRRDDAISARVRDLYAADYAMLAGS